MAEPASSASAFVITAFGLSVFGMATGLHPALLIVGLAGGLWAMFYGEPQPLLRRQYTVLNNTTGGFALAFIGASGTGVAVAAGKRAIVHADGTNVVRVTADT